MSAWRFFWLFGGIGNASWASIFCFVAHDGRIEESTALALSVSFWAAFL
jgi:acyl-[acyl carrier protein]--UDP-N-acetylglucosamine O-acyltransferase